MQAKVHTILGLRGSGKSRLLRAICRSHSRLVLIDTLQEHGRVGYVPLLDPDEFRRKMLASDSSPFRYGITPECDEIMEWVERACAARRGVCLAVDELDWWYPSSVHPIGEGLAAIVRYGRHYDQSLVVTVRRPTAISHLITSQSVIWSFPMSEPRDCEYVRKVSGMDPSRLSVPVKDSEGNTVVSEVIRTDCGDVKVCRFNLLTGEITA